MICGYHSIATVPTLPIPEKRKVNQKSAMYLDRALLLGSILKTKSPSMWVHEVLDPQNNL